MRIEWHKKEKRRKRERKISWSLASVRAGTGPLNSKTSSVRSQWMWRSNFPGFGHAVQGSVKNTKLCKVSPCPQRAHASWENLESSRSQWDLSPDPLAFYLFPSYRVSHCKWVAAYVPCYTRGSLNSRTRF